MESWSNSSHPLQDASSMSPSRNFSRPPLSRQPCLLPAFEPFSSSPPRPLATKRKMDSLEGQPLKHYPTPIPTSSTGILPSSPPRRPGLQRTLSTLSERAPLGDLPSVTIPANGDLWKFGRSSNSSQYQLPYNRHISRVHVTARYEAEPNASGRIVVQCLGWNGAKIRCGGAVHQLEKGDEWVSTQPLAEIMLDVLDCRVMMKWPDMDSDRRLEAWTEESSPVRRPFAAALGIGSGNVMPSSPPALMPRSPVSPSPARPAITINSDAVPTSDTLHESHHTAVDIFEDPNSDHINNENESPIRAPAVKEVMHARASITSLSSSNADGLSDQENEGENEGENEENDPIVHSFGPFGANLMDRLSSFSHSSPTQPQPRKRALKEASVSPQRPAASPISPRKSVTSHAVLSKAQESPIKNHVINQLAFSRVHAIPLSTIHSNLPAELRACATAANPNALLEHSELERLLHEMPCVGEINREGKDAAGKPLENEFYYVPEMDENAMRREAVLGSRGGTGLRAVRKNHKQYYWKKPRV